MNLRAKVIPDHHSVTPRTKEKAVEEEMAI